MVLLIIAITLLLFLVLYMWMEAHKDTIVEQILQFEEFPSSFEQVRIFFISDLHRRVVSENMINQVEGKVDLVIIGGDLVEKGVHLSQVEKNITRLKQLGPVYFVWGNNDYEIDHHELDALFLDKGVKTLDNNSVTFESDCGDKIYLIGVDDITSNRDRLDLAMMDVEANGFKILVSHNPAIIKKVKQDDMIQLILSGHTHGGQIRFFGLGIYEKGSMKKINHTHILISNGYGTTSIPLRLGAPAQTHLITICKK